MNPSSISLPLTLHVLTYLVSSAQAAYTLQEDYSPRVFFDKFDFFKEADPTNGYVYYTNETEAQSLGLVNTSSTQVYMGVDHTTIAQAPGRSSVRLVSTNSYNHGLIILDLEHMPGGICGTWPAFWLLGPNWPDSGEVDIIEGVNSASTNQMTLHTDAGCTVTNNGFSSGSILGTNCDVAATNNAGCSIATSNNQTYGRSFNTDHGGVYATEWTSEAIRVWFFPRNAIPNDITAGTPDPSGWGLTLAEFSGSCDIDEHFQNQQIVFDTTFCGDWAGEVWSTDPICSQKAQTCDDYVMNNPTDFTGAYWSINGLQVFQDNGANMSFTSVTESNTSFVATATSSVGAAESTVLTTLATVTSSFTSTSTTSFLSTSTSLTNVFFTTSPSTPTSFENTPTLLKSTSTTFSNTFAPCSSWSSPRTNAGSWTGTWLPAAPSWSQPTGTSSWSGWGGGDNREGYWAR